MTGLPDLEELLRGFEIPELELPRYGYTSPDETYDDPFKNGVKLKSLVIFVYSADTSSDCEKDIRNYDRFVLALNEKYGKVALTSAEAKQYDNFALGLINHRHAAFSQVIIETFGENPSYTVEFPAVAVKLEDERKKKTP